MIGYASHSANQTSDSNVIPSPCDGPWNGEPPPTDILDLCLDLYFGQFHIHLPFVHPGTFKACHTPSILLFPICVVGMMILDRTAAYKIIADYLPVGYVSCVVVASLPFAYPVELYRELFATAEPSLHPMRFDIVQVLIYSLSWVAPV
jgi:hypothetical protein